MKINYTNDRPTVFTYWINGHCGRCMSFQTGVGLHIDSVIIFPIYSINGTTFFIGRYAYNVLLSNELSDDVCHAFGGRYNRGLPYHECISCLSELSESLHYWDVIGKQEHES